MGIYIIAISNGSRITVERDKSPVGLWKWAIKQYTPRILSFDGVHILASEIVAIEEVEV